MGVSSTRVQQLRNRALFDLSKAKSLGYIVFGRKSFDKILLKKEYARNGFLTIEGRAFVFRKARMEGVL